MPMQKLCSGDWDRTLQFSVFDWNRSQVCFNVLKLQLCAHRLIEKLDEMNRPPVLARVHNM